MYIYVIKFLCKHIKHFSSFAYGISWLYDDGHTGFGFRQLQGSFHIFHQASPGLSEGRDPLNQQALDSSRSNKVTLIFYREEDKLGHHRAELLLWWVLPGHDTNIMSVRRNNWDLSLMKMMNSSLWNEYTRLMFLANSWISTVSVLLGITLFFIEARRFLAKYSTLFAPWRLWVSLVFVTFISKWIKDLCSMTLCWQYIMSK